MKFPSLQCLAPHRLGRRQLCGLLLMSCLWLGNRPALEAAPSIARNWNEQILAAIRLDTPHPPVQARNLFSLSACLYDAWAAYDTNGAVGFAYRAKHSAADLAAARREAMSYAALRILQERYSYSRSAATTLATLSSYMISLGYSPGVTNRNPATPAGVGNSVYDAVSAWFIQDGCRQTAGNTFSPYPDYPISEGGYIYVNDPMPVIYPGTVVNDVNRWQRLQIVNAVDQNGFPQGPIQTYLGAQWLKVRPFALTRTDASRPWIDPGPPPRLGTDTDAAFRSNVVEVIRASSQLTPDDNVFLNISPGALGNNSLGTNDGTGHPLNPATGQPYAANIVRRGDFVRVLAEFWADGPNSETPPGHWNTLANQVADHPAVSKRIGGTGPVVEDLEWDVKTYFSLNAAVHEAACAAWSIKRYYDGWRPITAIRYMGQLGQSSNPALPSYHPQGLPLVSNLIELVTTTTVASGRHPGLSAGKIAILAWPGQPADPTTTHQGVRWIHADTWVPYQRTNFVSPAFPGYVSGHSTFSRAAAEVLARLTGSPFFPGGLATHTAPAHTGLGFERGPSTQVQLQWATYYDAADQAGLSRIWGGIHPPADDVTGRRVGSECGQAAWELARKYWDGSIRQTPVTLATRRLNGSQAEFRFNTVRGFHYRLQSSTNLAHGFADEPGGSTLAYEGSLARTNSTSGPQKFYRVASSLTP
ncbi:MAG: hypothetical protein RJA22_1019 [Verrucomicrobiota bacterium]